jgi:hypothetical protein
MKAVTNHILNLMAAEHIEGKYLIITLSFLEGPRSKLSVASEYLSKHYNVFLSFRSLRFLFFISIIREGE